MATIYRYWLKEFARFFCIIQMILLCVFLAVDYLSNMDKFLEAKFSIAQAFGYVLLKVPFMFVQFTPAGVVLGTIVVFGLMNRNNELMALKGSGVSIYCLVKPVVLVGVLLAFLMIFLGETVVPSTMFKANHIKYSSLKKSKRIYAVREDIWMRGENKIIHINFFNPVDDTISGITVTFLQENFRIGRRVDAEKGLFENGQWRFFNVLEQNYAGDGRDSDIKSYDNKAYVLDIVPDDLKNVVKKTDQMSILELREYIKKVEFEGYDATRYIVDFWAKMAFPVICLVMALAGAGAGMLPSVKENMPLGIAMGIGVAFGYWVIHGFCVSLGYGGMLPPVLSAWAANLIFICSTILFLVTVGD
ncbi:MAG: LPS export ABC transporter permease LptG [Desulfobacteraceae bacterium]|nr:LPS export ABC transporter permease LptG [Desulfobacteraceae bacterium]